jgi:hypothetical protein
VRRGASIAIGVLLLTASAWLSVPRRGHPFEELRSECRWQDGTRVRSWQGNGGATTAFWYSVTTQTSMPWTEREIFFSYSSPIVTSMTCESDGVVIIADGTAWTLKATDLLSNQPRSLQFDHGQQTSGFARGNWGPTDIVRTVVGVVGVFGSGWFLWRRRVDSPLASRTVSTRDK